MTTKHAISRVLAQWGGSYAAALGIDLEGLRADEIYKWFFAALLYGARISESLATRTWQAFAQRGVMTPQRVLATGWNGLVAILDAGGYARYDYKTATKLLDVNRALLADYGGDLNALHEASTDPADLERRIILLGKGIGPTTVAIFLREMRGYWANAQPPLSRPALDAAHQLGILPASVSEADALEFLQRQWREAGKAKERFCDFESAMVRAGLNFRRHRTMISASSN